MKQSSDESEEIERAILEKLQQGWRYLKELQREICGRSRSKRDKFRRIVERLTRQGRVRRGTDPATNLEIVAKPSLPQEESREVVKAILLELGTEEASVKAYAFSADASKIYNLAQVVPLRKTDGRWLGIERYLRSGHVKQLTEYLLTDSNPIMPDAVILALKGFVNVEPDNESLGLYKLSYRYSPHYLPEERPFILIDGLHRLSSVVRSGKHLRVPVIALEWVPDERFYQKMFLVANTKRPVSRSLLHEIYVALRDMLPGAMLLRQQAATVVNRLDEDSDSPFYQLVYSEARHGPSSSQRIIPFASFTESILECFRGRYYGYVIERNKKFGPLFLQHYVIRRGDQERVDVDSCVRCLKLCFNVVKEVFPKAWGRPSHESKLMHSVGIRAVLQFLSYLVPEREILYPLQPSKLENRVREAFLKIKDRCYWTKEDWLKLEQEEEKRMEQLKNQIQESDALKNVKENLLQILDEYYKKVKRIIWKDATFTWPDITQLTNELIDLYEGTKCG
jgi:DGQHR domain-containing protein